MYQRDFFFDLQMPFQKLWSTRTAPYLVYCLIIYLIAGN